MLAQWERRLHEVALTPQTALPLAARWAEWVAAGGTKLDTGLLDGSPEAVANAIEGQIARHADEALTLAGISATPETQHVLIEAIRPLVWGAYTTAKMASAPPRWPHSPVVPVTARAAPATSLDSLFDAWKATASVTPRIAEQTGDAIDMLIKFLGHGDAARVTKDDLICWRTATVADGRTNATWNNRLSYIRQVFARGVADGKLATNPTDGLRLPKQRPNSWLPYGDEEAALILNAARCETQPSLRWAPWIMAFSGMRVAEVLQLTRDDIRQEGDIHYVAVNEDTPDKSVKNSQRRNVPIHPALIGEGFLEYVRGIAADAPLFPEKKLDRFGRRGSGGWDVVGKWVRETVGITDQRKAPNHSFRHRMEDELRAVETPEDVRDAILGHARKTTGRVYGVRGEALKRLYRYLSMVPVPAGVDQALAA
jgi:integrase